MSEGDPRPLVDVLGKLPDPKKIRSYTAVVDGLAKFFKATEFEARPVSKRAEAFVSIWHGIGEVA